MVDAVKTIGIGIDPRGSKTGARVVKAELQGIGRAADKAEKEVRELGRGGSAALKQVGTSAAAARPGITSLTGSVKGLAATFISVAAAARLVTGSINQSLDFSKAIGEVGTLGQDMDATAAKAREFAKTFGTDAAGQVKAFYQTFSAGASTLAEASTTLEAANKLAIGGATDVTTAVDGLTSIMNAYGDAAGSATDVSDTLFVAMKAGKTTIEELSSSLGRVTPLAAAAGVSFDEVAAAVAALTKGGITTRQAVTSLQQTISNIIKPSSEAAKEANRLGIEFNAAALKAQGFQGFMESTIEAAGGNVESLGKLFGSVEALTGVMALAGQAGLDFSDILDDMKNKAGSTEQAFETMSDSFDRKWSIAVAKAQDIGLTFGDALLTVLVPAMTLLADNIDLVISGFSALSVFWVTSKIVAFAGAIGSASVAAGGFAAALGAIAWPVAAAAATAAAIISIISAYNDAAEKAEVYRDLQNQVNEALGISETASKSAANAIEQKGISDLQAAQSLLKLNEALILNAKAMQFSPGGQSETEAVQNARLQHIAELQKKIVETEGAIADLFLIMKEGGRKSAETIKPVEDIAKVNFAGVISQAEKLSGSLVKAGESAGVATAKLINVQEFLAKGSIQPPTQADAENKIRIEIEADTKQAEANIVTVDKALSELPTPTVVTVEADTKAAMENIFQVISALDAIPRYVRSVVEVVTVRTEEQGGSRAQSAASAPPPIIPDFPQFAEGGIATTPSIFGEAGPEAAVPLPDGRTIPVTISGAGTLGAIEVNTARTAEFLERSLGFLETIDSDIVAMINEMQRQRTVSLGGSTAATGFGDTGFNGRIRGDDPLRDAFFGLPFGGSTGAGVGLQSPGPIKKVVLIGDQIHSVEYESGMQFKDGGVIPPSGSGNTDTRALQILTRPDESITIQTPEQRRAMVNNFDQQFERGKQSVGASMNFGDIHINVPPGTRMDRKSAQAVADGVEREIRSRLSTLHGD